MKGIVMGTEGEKGWEVRGKMKGSEGKVKGRDWK